MCLRLFCISNEMKFICLVVYVNRHNNETFAYFVYVYAIDRLNAFESLTRFVPSEIEQRDKQLFVFQTGANFFRLDKILDSLRPVKSSYWRQYQQTKQKMKQMTFKCSHYFAVIH